MKKKLLNHVHILVLPFYFVISDALVRMFAGLRLFSPRAIAFSYFIGLFFSGLSLLLKEKGQKIYLSIVFVISTLVAFSQSLYFNFYTDFYSFNKLSNIKEFLAVKGETTKAFHMQYLLYFVLLVFMIGWLIKMNLPIHNKKHKIQLVLGFVLFALLGYHSVKFTFINNMLDSTQVYLTDDYLYKTLYSHQKAVERFGVFTHANRDLLRIAKTYLQKADPKEVKRIEEYFAKHQREKQHNAMTGLFENKNIVLILAESLDPWGIHQEITPTLYKMKQEGIYFENYYAPMFNASTIDAEFMVNTGLAPSLESGNTAYVFSGNTFPLSLANLFKKKGYSAISYHNSIGSFYNRYQFHEALGFSEFYDSIKLDIETPKNFGYNWALDYDLFDKASDIILKQSRPFFSYLITVSMHTPYDENRIALKKNYEYVSKILPNEDSQIIYYLAAGKDLDDGLELFQKRLAEEGILDDTVFVVFGDHYSYGMHHDIIWTYDLDTKGDFYNLKKVPLLIWTPNMQEQKISEIAGQFEVYPTLANMFNLEFNPTYNFGNDIFNEDENIVVYGSKSIWRDKNLVYDTGNIGAKYVEDADESYIFERNSYVIERLNMFQKILEQDYFKEFKGE
ncbi:MAG: sulfatase-like hydrolase/transferase [Erysipelotrichaceae bacterium]|nr:sulfatase-like hydrolase/transferase [Erysipelotrichaceae bacterium]